MKYDDLYDIGKLVADIIKTAASSLNRHYKSIYTIIQATDDECIFCSSKIQEKKERGESAVNNNGFDIQLISCLLESGRLIYAVVVYLDITTMILFLLRHIPFFFLPLFHHFS